MIGAYLPFIEDRYMFVEDLGFRWQDCPLWWDFMDDDGDLIVVLPIGGCGNGPRRPADIPRHGDFIQLFPAPDALS